MTDQPFFLPATLFVVLGLPLLLGVVPPNRIYGIRSRRTLGDERAWYSTNRIAGLLAALLGGFYLVYAWLRPVAPGSTRGFDLTSDHTWVFGVPLLIVISVSCLRAWRR